MSLSCSTLSQGLDRDRIERLAADAERIARPHLRGAGAGFEGLITADPHRAHEALLRLRDGATSFLELGCGHGLITVMADLLGFDACGIEIRPGLLQAAEELARLHRARPRFVQGSYLPDDRDLMELVDPDFAISEDGAHSAWDEVRLSDFDVVYVFPWPSEEELFQELVRRRGRRGQRLLTYHAQDGFVIHPGGDRLA